MVQLVLRMAPNRDTAQVGNLRYCLRVSRQESRSWAQLRYNAAVFVC